MKIIFLNSAIMNLEYLLSLERIMAQKKINNPTPEIPISSESKKINDDDFPPERRKAIQDYKSKSQEEKKRARKLADDAQDHILQIEENERELLAKSVEITRDLQNEDELDERAQRAVFAANKAYSKALEARAKYKKARDKSLNLKVEADAAYDLVEKSEKFLKSANEKQAALMKKMTALEKKYKNLSSRKKTRKKQNDLQQSLQGKDEKLNQLDEKIRVFQEGLKKQQGELKKLKIESRQGQKEIAQLKEEYAKAQKIFATLNKDFNTSKQKEKKYFNQALKAENYAKQKIQTAIDLCERLKAKNNPPEASSRASSRAINQFIEANIHPRAPKVNELALANKTDAVKKTTNKKSDEANIQRRVPTINELLSVKLKKTVSGKPQDNSKENACSPTKKP